MSLDTEPQTLRGNQIEHIGEELMGEVFIAMPSIGVVSMELLHSFVHLTKPRHYFRTTNMIPLDKARNALVSDFLVKTPSATHILFWDDDIIPEPSALMQLWSHNAPIVSGLYFQKGPPFYPLMSLKVATPSGEQGYDHLIQWEQDKVYSVDGIGMGFALIRRDVFQNIDWPPFEFTEFSEDYSFCTKCREAGYEIKVDTSVLLKHIAQTYPVGVEDFKRHQDKLILKQVKFGE